MENWRKTKLGEKMSWNYRLIEHADPRGDWIGLHEVYYDVDGNVISWTENPATFVAHTEEGPQGITASLTRALNDSISKPMLVESVLLSAFQDPS